MASLVADYSDSDSENDSSDITSDEKLDSRIKEEPDEFPSKNKNFFASTESDSDNEDAISNKKFDLTSIKTEVKREKLPNPLHAQGKEKLPSIHEAASSRIGTCVFVNPFEEAEQAKYQILEKHVKLTAAAPKKPAHQPVCWKFRKGKCSMGKNCRFFHDLENQRIVEEEQETADVTSVDMMATGDSHFSQSPRAAYHPAAFTDARRRPMQPEPDDEDHYMSGMRKKKRYGVCDNMLPPKKAFESLQRQRAQERPWTMDGIAPN